MARPSLGVAVAERASMLALLLATGPFVASQHPERSLEIGPLTGQFFAQFIKRLTSHLHKMKAVKTISACGENWLAPL
jgi:hypothetical protein